MKELIPNPKILCCASILALSLAACSNNAGKIKPDATLADNKQSANHIVKLKKGHRTKKVGGRLPDPRSYDNLWDRLFDRFDLPEVSHQDVERELNWFINHPAYIERVQSRAEPFLYSIVKQLEKHNIPGELALLPVIESAFQPHAVSPAHAAGIWQFIPTTGRHYGLKQSHSYDGRRDIYASTRAAIKYLKKLHNDFNGDWLLAIAGYNCGEGAVARAIQRNYARGLPTDFWSLDLPQETRSYVPRLLAVARLFSESDQYGISLRPIPNQPLYKTVKMNSQVDLALAANAADISLEHLMELNPGFKRQHVDVDGTYRLFIPAHKKIVDFKEELARQMAGQSDFRQDAQADSVPVEASPADTSVLADATKTYDAGEAGLKPAATSVDTLEPPAVSASPLHQTAMLEEKTSSAEVKSSPAELVANDPGTSPAFSERADRVGRNGGDTPTIAVPEAPLALAQNYTVESPAEFNPVLETTDYEAAAVANARERTSPRVSAMGSKKSRNEWRSPGERPRTAGRESLSSSSRSESAALRSRMKNRDEPPAQQRQTEPDNSGKKVNYVIQEGDTVYSIARKHGMDVEDLKKMNRLARADDIKWGQSVQVWTKDAGKKLSMTKTGAGFKPSQSTRYTAREGETLFSISRRFNVTVADLRKWNGIKEDRQFRSGMNITVSGEKD